jgi:hypothetical protein
MEFIITKYAFSSGLFLVNEYELYEHNTKVDPQNFAAFSVFNKFALRILGETSVWYFNEGISAQGVIRNQFFPNDRNGRSMALTYINREEQKRIATIRKQINTQLPSPLSHRKADDARAFLAELRKAENTGS